MVHHLSIFVCLQQNCAPAASQPIHVEAAWNCWLDVTTLLKASAPPSKATSLMHSFSSIVRHVNTVH